MINISIDTSVVVPASCRFSWGVTTSGVSALLCSRRPVRDQQVEKNSGLSRQKMTKTHCENQHFHARPTYCDAI